MIAIIFLQVGFAIQISLIMLKDFFSLHCCLLDQVSLHRYGRVAHWFMKESHSIFEGILWSLRNHTYWTGALFQALIFWEHALIVFWAIINLIELPALVQS